MKKFLFVTVFAMALFSASSVSNASVQSASVKSSMVSQVLRGSLYSGSYIIYIYAEPSYYGSFPFVTVQIQNSETGQFFTPTSKTGYLTYDSFGDYVSMGKARFIEDNVQVEIYFDGYLN